MANCNKLYKEVSRYRANWHVKHAASCKHLAAGKHSNSCKGAYKKYLGKLGEWSSACTKRSVDGNYENISDDELRAMEKEFDMVKD